MNKYICKSCGGKEYEIRQEKRRCIPCIKKVAKKCYEKNKEKTNLKVREKRSKNKEATRKKARDYYKKKQQKN